MVNHSFDFRPISLHRGAVEEICTICGCRSWRYKDGTRWLPAGEPENCRPGKKLQAMQEQLQEKPQKL